MESELPLPGAEQYVPSKEIEVRASETPATAKGLTVGERLRRIPLWCWVPPSALLALSIITAGLAVGLPQSIIDNQIYELHKNGHFAFSNALLHLSCITSPGETCIHRGEIAIYSRGCDAREAPSCVKLGDFYRYGQGIPRDHSRAAKLYKEACDAGEVHGCGREGSMFDLGHGVALDRVRATALYKHACDAGDAHSCDALGAMYYLGRSVVQDFYHARTLFEKACDQGIAHGCTDKALMLESGQGGWLNPTGAKELFYKACYADDAIADPYGCSLAENDTRAKRLFAKSCAAGNAHSCTGLASLYDSKYSDLKVSQEESSNVASLYTKACDAADTESCIGLGVMYLNGDRVAKDQPRAMALFNRACDAANADGCIRVGDVYLGGDWVTKDRSRAMALYRRACDAGRCDVFNAQTAAEAAKPTSGTERGSVFDSLTQEEKNAMLGCHYGYTTNSSGSITRNEKPVDVKIVKQPELSHNPSKDNLKFQASKDHDVPIPSRTRVQLIWRCAEPLYRTVREGAVAITGGWRVERIL